MKWLQWSTIDLERGIGGAEIHARSLHRELQRLGVESQISHRPLEPSENWDVIHTHGSLVPFGFKKKPHQIWVHTLHGFSFARMLACREFFWPGGYWAALKEIKAALSADIVLSVQPDVFPFKLARLIGKKTLVCGNGYDAWTSESHTPLPANVSDFLGQSRKKWVFIGRGQDKVKGTLYLEEAIGQLQGTGFLIVPGEGVTPRNNTLATGVLSPEQIHTLLQKVDGLVLSSLYEGLPLVVLEALSLGTPVVTSDVGGIRTLPANLVGLKRVRARSSAALAEAIETTPTSSDREHAKIQNRKLLQSWSDVAKLAKEACQNESDEE